MIYLSALFINSKTFHFMRRGALAALCALALNACATSTRVEDASSITFGKDGPLVVLLGGSEGGYVAHKQLTNAFLSKGFRVSQFAYFDFPNGPINLDEVNANAIAKHIKEVRDDAPRKGACTAVLGVSKGAELALVLAAYQNVADVTAALVPSNVVWQSPRTSIVGVSSWALNGQPMPFVPYPVLFSEALMAVLDVEQALPLHRKGLENQEAVKRATIEVERINHPVLLQAGVHDQIWPSFDMSKKMMRRVNALNPKNQFTFEGYDHDHFILDNAQAFTSMISFVSKNLKACERKKR